MPRTSRASDWLVGHGMGSNSLLKGRHNSSLEASLPLTHLLGAGGFDMWSTNGKRPSRVSAFLDTGL
jgi:hypothetical protein